MEVYPGQGGKDEENVAGDREERAGRSKLDACYVGSRLIIVKASPFDNTWGVGYTAANAEANRGNWEENLLGKALMRVRERLQEEEERHNR